MKKALVLTLAIIFSITLSIQNISAQEETGASIEKETSFFDWLKNLFGGFVDDGTIEESHEKQDDIKRAAVIDQLYHDIPNPYFQNKTIGYLTDAGYEVDLISYEEITVDFYKNLPQKDYDFIIFRTHALAIKDKNKEPSSWLFTGEKYSTNKYIQEQLNWQVSMAVPYRSAEANQDGFENYSKDRHFIISNKYVEELMVGQFPDSTIILGGCDTLTNPFLGDAFVSRGASSVIGWSGLVDSIDNDEVMLSLLDEIFVQNMTAQDAVDSVMKDFKPGVKLKFHSSGASGEV